MQLIPRYLVKNKIDVVSNDIGFVVEYRPVYSRQLKVYRGIDNQFQFRLLNADQKPVTITGVPVIVVFDENNSKIIDKKCAVQDDGSSVQGRGMFNVTITENELLNIKEQYLKYNVYIEGDESNLITYADRNFGSAGTMFVDGNAYPGPKSSLEITDFVQIGDYWATGGYDAQPGLNGNEALHTSVIYTNAYIGTVEIQATLDDQLTGANNWTTIDTITFIGSETQPVPTNFNGVFTFLRFKVGTDPASKITKILVRN